MSAGHGSSRAPATLSVVAQRQLPLLRFLLLVALSFGAVTAFWLAPAVNAGRDMPISPTTDGLSGGSSGRQLQGILSGGHDETNDKLMGLLKPSLTLTGDPGPCGLARLVRPQYAISSKQAPAPVPEPVPVVAPAQPAAVIPAVAAAGPVVAPPTDAVAMAAAQALLGGNKGGINIVSTSPIALDNPIDIFGGNYNARGSAIKTAGH
ncbi:hypothetical protein TSOC_009599 [Tetrabaena socialis]|uniref:Uncharacterized protein n=1 Tax=Tetrabaena socialis TaxID=47790 RepID=A0A2J7ZVF8_9CHLO|nr:hypothetical protein TSOC_009599 [Tetrabaena socialis]|eukprot:PNH04252.1 hypothetical protein TSOC_009599 [Tetrabaena socialis]